MLLLKVTYYGSLVTESWTNGELKPIVVQRWSAFSSVVYGLYNRRNKGFYLIHVDGFFKLVAISWCSRPINVVAFFGRCSGDVWINF